MGNRYVRREVPFRLHEVRILNASDAELAAISKDLGLALSVDEMHRVRDYFLGIGREPTDVEIQSLGQAWSEHCCYKSSKVFLKEFIFPVQTADVIDRGDAGVMAFDDDHAYALRIESHNHPSAVEPYGGATTGIGGILRDVLAMGAQPIALVAPLHFGPLDVPYDKLPHGLKHPKYLFGGVVAGIRDYGNRRGIPAVAGCVVFDDGYLGNIVVNVGCVGFAEKSQLQRNRVREAGDVYVLCGGRTGRFHRTELNRRRASGFNFYSTTPSLPLCDPMYHSRPRASVTILRMPTLLEGSCTTRICSVFGSKRTTVSVLISFTHTMPPPSTVTA